MPREYTCAYGDCPRTTITVSVTTRDERPKFCTTLHAGMFLLREASYSHPDPAMRRKLGAAHDELARLDTPPEAKVT